MRNLVTSPATKSLSTSTASSGFSVQLAMHADGSDIGSKLYQADLAEHLQEQELIQAREAYLEDQTNQTLKNNYREKLEKEKSNLQSKLKDYQNQQAYNEKQAAQESKSYSIQSMWNYYLGTTQSEVERYADLVKNTTVNIQAINKEIGGLQSESKTSALPPIVGQFPPIVTLSTMPSTAAKKIVGTTPGAETGISLAGADGKRTGRKNNDVFGDNSSAILVGASGENSNTGKTYILRNTLLSNPYPLSSLNTSVGVSFPGENKNDYLGAGGDIGFLTGQSYSDIAIGSGDYSNVRGCVYIIQGGPQLQNLKSLVPLNSINTTRILGINPGDYTGSNLVIGDLDGDGQPDLIASAHGATGSNNASRAGIVYYVQGGPRLTPPQTFYLSNMTNVSRMIGFASQSQAGWNVAVGTGAAGSFVVIGTFTGQYTFIVYGRSLLSSIDLNNLGNTGATLSGPPVTSGSQWAAATVGDINGDGNDDVITSAPSVNIVYVVYGPVFGSITLSSMTQQGFSIQGPSGQAFGTALSTGDINKDGFKDVLISSPTGNRVHVVFGSSNITVRNVDQLDGRNGFTISGPSGDSTGFDLSGIPDVTGDNVEDVLITSAQGFGTGVGYVTLMNGDVPPVRSNSTVHVIEGRKTIVNSTMLSTTDENHSPADLTYTATITNGIILNNNGATVTKFTQQDIDDEKISILPNGITQLTVGVTTPGIGYLQPTSVSVIWHVAPVVTVSTLGVLKQGSTLVLNSSNFNCTHPDYPNVIWNIVNGTGGNFTLVTNTSNQNVTSFTQSQINQNQITYADADDGEAPEFQVVATDGYIPTSTLPVMSVSPELFIFRPEVTKHGGVKIRPGKTDVELGVSNLNGTSKNNGTQSGELVFETDCDNFLNKYDDSTRNFTQAQIQAFPAEISFQAGTIWTASDYPSCKIKVTDTRYGIESKEVDFDAEKPLPIVASIGFGVGGFIILAAVCRYLYRNCLKKESDGAVEVAAYVFGWEVFASKVNCDAVRNILSNIELQDDSKHALNAPSIQGSWNKLNADEKQNIKKAVLNAARDQPRGVVSPCYGLFFFRRDLGGTYGQKEVVQKIVGKNLSVYQESERKSSVAGGGRRRSLHADSNRLNGVSSPPPLSGDGTEHKEGRGPHTGGSEIPLTTTLPATPSSTSSLTSSTSSSTFASTSSGSTSSNSSTSAEPSLLNLI